MGRSQARWISLRFFLETFFFCGDVSGKVATVGLVMSSDWNIIGWRFKHRKRFLSERRDGYD